jgi:hypothetical protein
VMSRDIGKARTFMGGFGFLVFRGPLGRRRVLRCRGSGVWEQYLSVRYSQRLADDDIVASVGSKSDSFDNAMAASFNGLYKWELIYPTGPWRGLDDPSSPPSPTSTGSTTAASTARSNPALATPPRPPSKPPPTVRPSPPTRPGLNSPSFYQTQGASGDAWSVGGLRDCVELPGSGHSFELMAASAVEPEARSDDEFTDGAGREHLAGLGLSCDSRTDVDGHPGDCVLSVKHLAGVKSDSHVQSRGLARV